MGGKLEAVSQVPGTGSRAVRFVLLLYCLLVASCTRSEQARISQVFDSESRAQDRIRAADLLAYSLVESNSVTGARATLIDPIGSMGLRKARIGLKVIHAYPAVDAPSHIEFDFWELYGTPYSGGLGPERFIPGEIHIVLLKKMGKKYSPVRHAWRTSFPVLAGKALINPPADFGGSREEWVTWMSLTPPAETDFRLLQANFEILCDNTKRAFGVPSLIWFRTKASSSLKANSGLRSALDRCIGYN